MLYPDILPFRVEHIDVGDGHSLYLEECGNPKGVPVIFLHGGPGAGCEPYHRRFFNPEKYRIILFDQRGAGKSRPHASLENNTTNHLIADLEILRQRLQVSQWVVFGGSWGSTLGLAYAQAYPENVLGLILRGIFLCRDEDIQWFYQQGANRIFPHYWQDFLAPIPENERDNLLQAYFKRLTGDDEIARMKAAEAWSVWEGRAATLRPDPNIITHFSEPFFALGMARIESYYFVNQAFLQANQLLEQAHRLKNIPGDIVHGRYDMICPIDQAYALHHAWPDANLTIVPDAGHAASEVGIVEALVHATNAMLERI